MLFDSFPILFVRGLYQRNLAKIPHPLMLTSSHRQNNPQIELPIETWANIATYLRPTDVDALYFVCRNTQLALCQQRYHSISITKAWCQLYAVQLLSTLPQIHPVIEEVVFRDIQLRKEAHKDDVLHLVRSSLADNALGVLLGLETIQIRSLILCNLLLPLDLQRKILSMPYLERLEFYGVEFEKDSRPLPIASIQKLHLRGPILNMENFLDRCAPRLVELSFLDSPADAILTRAPAHVEYLPAIANKLVNLRRFVLKGQCIIRFLPQMQRYQQDLLAFLSRLPQLSDLRLGLIGPRGTHATSSALPNLVHIEGPEDTIRRFVVGRPIRSVHITEEVYMVENKMADILAELAQTLVPVEELKLAIAWPMPKIAEMFATFLPALRRLDLKIQVRVPDIGCLREITSPIRGRRMPNHTTCGTCTVAAPDAPLAHLEWLRIECKVPKGIRADIMGRLVENAIQPHCPTLQEVVFEMWVAESEDSLVWKPEKTVTARKVDGVQTYWRTSTELP